MTQHQNYSYKGDPSDVQQRFPSYDLQLLCCRFWQLRRWEFRDLSFPYWRVYYNFQRGAHVQWDEGEIELSPNKIYLIAPNTSYSTYIKGHKIPEVGFRLEGKRISRNAPIGQYIQHLFIHFNLGIPYDNITPGIITVDKTAEMQHKIDAITSQLVDDAVHFSFAANLTIRALINELLCTIPQERWQALSQDNRIVETLNYIDKNIAKDLSNDCLAKQVGLATNSFTRLFTKEAEISPQRYVKRKRIDNACIMLHHSNYSIKRIAVKTGFSDRYHFSRVFKEITNNSPANYRKLK